MRVCIHTSTITFFPITHLMQKVPEFIPFKDTCVAKQDTIHYLRPKKTQNPGARLIGREGWGVGATFLLFSL